MTSEVEVMDWPMNQAYSLTWDGILTPESMAHPAKASRALLRLIFDDLFARGELKRGDLVLDPFGGIGSTGIESASRGCRFVGCELEEKFFKLAQENFDLHRRTWLAAGDPLPVAICGNSRELSELVAPALAAACVSSPPYSESNQNYQEGLSWIDKDKSVHKGKGFVAIAGASYGTTDGNLGNLPPGTPPADAAAVVSSPPWENQEPSHAQNDTPSKRRLMAHAKPGCIDAEYGSTAGQVGNTSGTTFWDAARQIVRQTRLCLKDGAVSAWIVKAYVKKGKIVPFPDQWAALLESEGFRVVRRARAWLVQETHEPDLFGGEAVKRKERKSFFRRLHEKKSPGTRIDFEEVVFAVKVGPGGDGDAVVSSPPYAESLNNHGEGSHGRPNQQHGTTQPDQHYGTTAGQLGAMKAGEAPQPTEELS